MKIYPINGPQKLREIANCMPNYAEKTKALSMASVWSASGRPGKNVGFNPMLVIGRTAFLFYISRGESTVVGTVKLTAAREIARGMEESK